MSQMLPTTRPAGAKLVRSGRLPAVEGIAPPLSQSSPIDYADFPGPVIDTPRRTSPNSK